MPGNGALDQQYLKMKCPVKTVILTVSLIIAAQTACIFAQRSNNNDFPFPPVTNNNILGNQQQREPPRDIFGNTINQQTPDPRDRDGNIFNNNNDNTNTNNNFNNQNNNNFNNQNSNNNPFDTSRLPTRQDTFNNPFSNRRDPFNSFTPRLDISDASFTFAGNEEKHCPLFWDGFRESCYRFVKSPTHSRIEAQRYCQVWKYKMDLKLKFSIKMEIK